MDAAPPSETKTTAVDPVCGMSVDPATARWTAEHAGKPYYFCSEGCRDRFVATPESYLGDHFALPVAGEHRHAAPRRAAASAPKGTAYTCPMHPRSFATAPAIARSAAWRSSRSGVLRQRA